MPQQLLEKLENLPIQPNLQKTSIQVPSIQAYLYMALSNVSLVIMQLFFKQLTHLFAPALLLGIRASLLFIINLYPIFKARLNLNIRHPQIFRMIVKRSFVCYLTVALFICSIKYIPIGMSNALQNTSPIITFFVQIIYYKKNKIHWINFLILIVCFVGVILIIQPQFLFREEVQRPNENLIYYGMVLLGAFFSSFSMIFLHDLREKCNQVIALQYAYIFQCIFNVLFFLSFVGSTENRFATQNKEIEYGYFSYLGVQNRYILIAISILLMTIFAYIAQYLRYRSIYMCSPALVMPFNYINVILGFLIDTIIFKISYNWMSILGMLMSSTGLFSKFIVLKLKKEQIKTALKPN